jgi:hypothetical protein
MATVTSTDPAVASASAKAAISSLSAVMASASAAMASESTVETGEAAAPSYYKYIGILLAVLSGTSIYQRPWQPAMSITATEIDPLSPLSFPPR